MPVAYSLYLFPETSEANTGSTSDLVSTLIEHRFMSLGPDADVYRPGEQLMTYINFLGCSPSLASGQLQATIVVHEFEHLTAMGGRPIETIRCPQCRHPLQHPDQLLNNYSSNKRWICPGCDNAFTFMQINWRKSVGISTLFLEISPVFPKEALPGEELLRLLGQTFQCNWSWFYSEASSRAINTDL